MFFCGTVWQLVKYSDISDNYIVTAVKNYILITYTDVKKNYLHKFWNAVFQSR